MGVCILMSKNSTKRDEGRSQPEDGIFEKTRFTPETDLSHHQWGTIAARQILQSRD